MNKLDERRKKILWAIIQSHIDLNTPIGSLLISKRFPVGLSSATIRNTMAQLEKLGYICQPHTSAGRIPTEKGYRFYVDTILEDNSLQSNQEMSGMLSTRLKNITRDNKIIVKEAVKTLSSFSRYLAIATPPFSENIVLQKIRFIKYEKKKALAFLISEDGTVKNNILKLEKEHSQQRLDEAADILNEKFCGLTVKKVREKLAYQLYREKAIYDELVENLFYLCKDILAPESDTLSLNGLSGTSNLTDFASANQIKAILKAIEDKYFMLKLLQQISESKGTQVFVGMENILPAMKELSMVISTYNNSKYAHGAIGIIGPTRMNYREMIPIVDDTAKALSRILSKI
jgi:heat-inducible transcriptional repressor